MRQAMGCRDDEPSFEKARRAERSYLSFWFSREGVGEPALNDKSASAVTYRNDRACRCLSIKRKGSLIHQSSFQAETFVR